MKPKQIDPERWQQIEKLYHTALEQEASQRRVFIEKVCSGDQALRDEVESLLRSDDRAGQFMETPALQAAAQLHAESHEESMIGRRLGPYELLSLLGTGAMGEVYRARDSRLDRDVAIKVLPEHLADSPEALTRFQREVKAVAALSHPNILAIHDIGMEQGVCFAVTELLEGETLGSCLAVSALPWRRAVEIAASIANGLAAAHAKAIIHRDLKPENVFLTKDGRVKILDFGIARVKPVVSAGGLSIASTVITRPGMLIGTVGYMSPEQARGEDADVPSDIFSLGCILYEMVAGQRAFGRQTPAETLAAILKEEPAPLSESEQECPLGLQSLIQHCLEKIPENRFQSAQDLAFHLGGVLSGSGTETGPAGTPGLRLRKARWPVLAIVVLVLGMALAWWQPWRPNPFKLLRQHLISTFPGAHRESSFSPDGSMIAFVNQVGGPPQIWLKNLWEGEPLQITTGEQPAHRPRWSPRNDQIVFSRGVGWQQSIWTVPPLGGRPRRIIEDGRNPSFSADGSQLVYEKGEEIWTAKPDGSEQHKVEGVPVVEFLLTDRTPALSPDGSQIAFFQCTGGPHGDVWVIPSAGGQARQLTFDDHFGGTLTWTPDGRWIVFSSLRSGSRTLWRIAATGAEPEVLLQGAGEDTEPELSRDGTKLVYTNTRNYFILTLWNPATNQSRELREARYDITNPSFSPHKDKIAFFEIIDNGEVQIYTIEPDGSNLTQVTRGKGERNIHPCWAADGSALCFYQSRPTRSFRRIPATGGQSVEIAAGWEWGTHVDAQVDPTGKHIAYTRMNSGAVATFIREIETGKETVFTPTLRNCRWSRDGKSLLGSDVTAKPQSYAGEISICSVETGTCQKLTKGSYPHWSIDESRIYFMRYSRGREGRELWSISSDGRDEKLVGLLPIHPIGTFFDVSAQGEIVYVRYSPGKPELWLAEFSRP
jgi:serine/threonine protein kinase